jgi:hypothetical protein
MMTCLLAHARPHTHTAKPIHKSLKLHAFLPIKKRGILTVKKASTSAEYEECCVTELQENYAS